MILKRRLYIVGSVRLCFSMVIIASAGSETFAKGSYRVVNVLKQNGFLALKLVGGSKEITEIDVLFKEKPSWLRSSTTFLVKLQSCVFKQGKANKKLFFRVEQRKIYQSWIRTKGLQINVSALYQLSYRVLDVCGHPFVKISLFGVTIVLNNHHTTSLISHRIEW